MGVTPNVQIEGLRAFAQSRSNAELGQIAAQCYDYRPRARLHLETPLIYDNRVRNVKDEKNNHRSNKKHWTIAQVRREIEFLT